MKRILVLLLLVALLLPSCSLRQQDGASGTESAGSENQTDEESINSTAADKSSVFVHTLDRKTENKKECLSAGKSYTFTREPNKLFPDNGGMLTDNITDDNIYDDNFSTYVGFIGKQEVSIVIDLGEVYKKVTDINAVAEISSANGYNLARQLDIYISDNNIDFIRVGGARTNISDAYLEGYIYEVTLQKGVDCRYVKFVFSEQITNFLLISELGVYTISEGKKDDMELQSIYENELMPEVTEDIYFNKSDADYNESKNLISGLNARIYEGKPVYEAYKVEWSNSPVSKASLLTNGKRGTYDLNDSEYFHVRRGYNRDFVCDMGAIGTVSAYSFSGLNDRSSGVFIPDKTELWLSKDGKNWQLVHSVTPATDDRELQLYEFSYKLGSAYKCRFIKVTMYFTAFAWLDEISVTGTKAISPDAKEIIPNEKEVNDSYPNEFRSPEYYTSKGIPENIALICVYKYTDMERFRLTSEQMLPYIAYLDKDGKISDTLFDGINISPPWGNAPSGGNFSDDETNPSKMTDWEAFYEELFLDGYNLDAIDETTKQVKEALGLGADYKVKISVTLFAACATQHDFGDIDGDGKSEDLDSTEARIKVNKWQMDKIKTQFEAKGYKNIELGGFYWLSESIDVSRKDITTVVKAATDYAHQLGCYVVWIPFSEAPGFNQVNDLGFDAVTMQPNYMFHDDWPVENIQITSDLSKKLGIGVEMEMDNKMFMPEHKSSYYDKYLAYLNGGARFGYMNTIKMYYQDAGPGLFYQCCHSDDAKTRLIYDYNYMYAKRRYKTDIGNVTQTDFSTVKNTELTTVLKTEKIANFYGVKIVGAAFNGTASIDSNGKITYIPDCDFVGTDTFQIGLEYSDPVTITVNVTE